MDIDCLSSPFVKKIVSGDLPFYQVWYLASMAYTLYLQTSGILKGADGYCNADNTDSEEDNLTEI
jgi:hypothetical protein